MEYSSEKISQANSFIIDSNEYFIPFGESINVDEEKEKLRLDLTYTLNFLESVRKKLTNEKFISGAPMQVIEIERKKESDALSKIAVLEQKLEDLN